MADGAFLPPWLQPANPAEHLAQGYRIGIALGAQQAEQAFREQQSMRQQQEDAERRAQWEAEFGLRAKQAADKAAAIQDYQNAIAGGMDPVQAITRFGPRMQEPGAAMAAALRASQTPQRPIAPDITLLPGIGNAVRTGVNRFQVVPDKKGEAQIVEHPEFPGAKFLRQPTGHEQLITQKGELTRSQRLHLMTQAYNMMKLGAQELQTDPSYQSRLSAAQSILNELKDEGTPGKIQDYINTDAKPAAQTKTAPAPSKGKRILVKSPSGKYGTIPEEQLDEALAQGYTKADARD